MPHVVGWALLTLGSLALVEVIRREKQRVAIRVAEAERRMHANLPVQLEQDPITGKYRPRDY